MGYRCKITIVGNKLDLCERERKVTWKEGEEFCKGINGIENVIFGGEASAKTGEGVERVILSLIDFWMGQWPHCEKCGALETQTMPPYKL